MNSFKTILLLMIFLLCINLINAQKTFVPSFKVVPLGVKGGSDESNLSSYMLAVAGSNDYVCLDAGTIDYGIQKAIRNGIFHETEPTVLKNNIKAYLISHPHLDHVAGLIINSPDDSSKNIYAFPFCIDVLKENYFTWKSWANFANEGEKPMLNKYHYIALSPDKETPIENTSLFVTPFILSHANPNKSSAFLIRHNDAFILYLGDTGADTTEHTDNLAQLWQYVAPLIKEKKMKAIFIETSFSNEQPDKLLFGHLTPRLLMQEMNALAQLTGTTAIENLAIIITHEKPAGNREKIIQTQLKDLNNLKLKLFFPEQARVLSF